MSRRWQPDFWSGVLVAALAVVALWTGRPAHANARDSANDALEYASPLEVLLSPDGARLYVLCQQSNEVRILNASSFALIKTIAVGRVPRLLAALDGCTHLLRADVWFSEAMLEGGNLRLFTEARRRGIATSLDLNFDPYWSTGARTGG